MHCRAMVFNPVACRVMAGILSLGATATAFAERGLPALEPSLFVNDEARGRYEPHAIRLWGGAAPEARGDAAADIPRLYPVPPSQAGGPPRPVMLVLPGGGYRYHSDAEAFPIAEWFRDRGFAAFVLEYRLKPYGPDVALLDAQRAIRVLRVRAKELNLDAGKIALIGFSAGGHLGANVSTHGDDGNPLASDPLERASCRVQSALLFYPAILDRFAERPAAGRTPIATLAKQAGLQQDVDVHTAPTFLIVGYDDARAPYENCLVYAERLHEAGVRFELHILGAGDHGMSIREGRRQAWEPLALDWLKTCGFVVVR